MLFGNDPFGDNEEGEEEKGRKKNDGLGFEGVLPATKEADEDPKTE